MNCYFDNGMIFFKSAIKGYNKKDVNTYIEQMNIRFTARENELKARIIQLEKIIKNKKDAENMCSKLQDDDGKTKINTQTDGFSCVEKNEAGFYKKSLFNSDNFRINCSEDTSSEYKNISTALGKIILKANLDAERLLSEAKTEAEKQVTEAEKEAGKIRADANASAHLMTEKVKENLALTVNGVLSELTTFSEEAILEYKKIFENLKKDFDLISISHKNIKM